jgi:hypothetical protein
MGSDILKNITFLLLVCMIYSCSNTYCSTSSSGNELNNGSTTNSTSNKDIPITAFYGGGIMYKEKNREAVIDELRKSGLSTIIVWTIHIMENGDLNFNAEFPVVKDGVYVGDETHPNFVADIALLKTSPTSINRVEFGLASAGSGTFNHVKSFYESEGLGPGTTLYKNFKALQEAIPGIDAFNNDDEVTYHVESAVAFTKMLAEMGFKNAIVPYKNKSFWKSLVEKVNAVYPGNIDRNYLQCYAGGRFNDPCSSSWDFGIEMIPGLWGGPNGIPAEKVADRMADWYQGCNITGGFIWDYEKFALTPDVIKYIKSIQYTSK